MTGTAAFDVVVVGGGAAGCVVAARLAESPSRSVLLLEAGPDLREHPPEGFRDGWQLPQEHDWGFMSEPDAGGNVERLRRIKLLGGTSWLTRFAPRGSPADYDGWEALGNDGWAFDEVLPYFARLEADLDFGDRPWHGAQGPIPVTRYLDLEYTEAAAASLDALQASGFPLVEDHNRPGAVGAGRMPMSSRDGIRVTTSDTYLPRGGTPPNLTVRTEAHVADLVFEGTRASGVRLVDGTVIEAGWVVLSAGTYGSPPLLLRSGIGPAEHLGSVGIPVRLDLPGVGANLADHSGVDIDCGYRGETRHEPVLHLIASFHSDSIADDDAPDLMFWLSDPTGGDGELPWFGIDILLMRPRSRGSVGLRSADPTDPPRIVLPGVTDRSDVERLAQGYARALEVASRPEIRRLCAVPPLAQAGAADELREWIRLNSFSVPHVVGTCAMGPRPDDGAVVDASGRVHGAERLSVVDASIMPDAPSGFTHLPTIMIAERLSERIASAV